MFALFTRVWESCGNPLHKCWRRITKGAIKWVPYKVLAYLLAPSTAPIDIWATQLVCYHANGSRIAFDVRPNWKLSNLWVPPDAYPAQQLRLQVHFTHLQASYMMEYDLSGDRMKQPPQPVTGVCLPRRMPHPRASSIHGAYMVRVAEGGGVLRKGVLDWVRERAGPLSDFGECFGALVPTAEELLGEHGMSGGRLILLDVLFRAHPFSGTEPVRWDPLNSTSKKMLWFQDFPEGTL
jgi:hypothetical protein